MKSVHSVFLFLAAAFPLLNSGCGGDSSLEEPVIPPFPVENGSPFADRVFEYTPAPGQFINDSRAGGMPSDISSPDVAAAWAEERLGSRLFVSLGAFGGYIVAGFDHDIVNSRGDYDFAVLGNAFLDASGSGGSSEPGIVYVMPDTNGNGLPDDTWYELKGSQYHDSNTLHSYSVTYRRPASPASPVEWTDNKGNSGTIDYLSSHPQDYYYPSWIDTDSYTLSGTCLKARSVKDTATGFWSNPPYDWGYADNMGEDNTSSLDVASQANRFRISDAVDKDGKHVELDCIRFVKVQTGVNAKCGPLGEVSTEILGIYDLNTPDDGTLFIVNEGNFQYGNASISVYNPDSKTVVNEAFMKANGMKLGDVAQSMTMNQGIGWIVVNNSHVVFAVDATTLKEKGRIENLTSPRYIHFISDTKAYVTQLWDNRIFIVNPKTCKVTGYIDIPDMEVGSGSTEQMVSFGNYVFCNCWSYQNRILRIDTDTDRVVDSLEVGIQPNSLVLDCNGKLWTVTDGGYEGSPFGYEPPALVKIDAASFSIEKKFVFSIGESCSEISINKEGSCIYWINDDVWKMDVNALSLPEEPFLKTKGTLYYGLTIAPHSGDVYIADAVDYQQQGRIYRYSSSGRLIDSFSVGITPGAFCWSTP